MNVWQREPDRELASYFKNKYGPYSHGPVVPAAVARCELCGANVARYVSLTSGVVLGVSLTVCVINECLEAILGPQEAAKIKTGLAVPNKLDWADSGSAVSEPAMEDEVPEGPMPDRETVAALAIKAGHFRKAGYGRKWRIVPSILLYFAEHDRVSFKQYEVLVKFVAACRTESGSD